MSLAVILSESVGANATKDESKDPENASSAMLRQGILPKKLPSFSMEIMRGKELRENSLKLYGEGDILGMLRLCARSANGTRTPLSTTGQKAFAN